MNGRTIPAVITASLSAGSTTSPFFYDVNIMQTLCHEVCFEDTPVFDPQFTLKSVAPGGVTGLYIATINVQGVISYIPCGCGSCATRQQVINQDFTISIKSATEPTVTMTVGTTENGIVKSSCRNCSKTFVSETALSIAVA